MLDAGLDAGSALTMFRRLGPIPFFPPSVTVWQALYLLETLVRRTGVGKEGGERHLRRFRRRRPGAGKKESAGATLLSLAKPR